MPKINDHLSSSFDGQKDQKIQSFDKIRIHFSPKVRWWPYCKGIIFTPIARRYGGGIGEDKCIKRIFGGEIDANSALFYLCITTVQLSQISFCDIMRFLFREHCGGDRTEGNIKLTNALSAFRSTGLIGNNCCGADNLGRSATFQELCNFCISNRCNWNEQNTSENRLKICKMQ